MIYLIEDYENRIVVRNGERELKESSRREERSEYHMVWRRGRKGKTH